jgi:hypothetical protein
MIINTDGMSFVEWAQAVSFQLGLNGDNVQVDPAAPWQQWALRIMLLPQVTSQSVPRPDQFGDWTDWATAFNRSVRY